MATKAQLAERDQAREDLRKLCPPNTTVYTILRHVSRSGMTRDLDLYVMEDNQPRRITYSACLASGQSYNRNAEAMRVGGCGMDMGFHAVYVLSSSLYPDGFECVGSGCPSNDHSNADLPLGATVRTAAGSVGTVVENGWSEHRDRGVVVVGFDDDTTAPIRVRDLEVISAHHTSGGYALPHRWM